MINKLINAVKEHIIFIMPIITLVVTVTAIAMYPSYYFEIMGGMILIFIILFVSIHYQISKLEKYSDVKSLSHESHQTIYDYMYKHFDYEPSDYHIQTQFDKNIKILNPKHIFYLVYTNKNTFYVHLNENVVVECRALTGVVRFKEKAKCI